MTDRTIELPPMARSGAASWRPRTRILSSLLKSDPAPSGYFCARESCA